ncbi:MULTISPECIES: APC family permease [Lacticaseibacillus]|uniref:APC family permease n=1 Tax=Lacticaseibacillus huelsenbergensis TaxID=3035291 RepID=A0ABY8DTN3_9LACO|nr:MULTISPECIES: APC family permease [Lacticaseibacillus]MDG3062394.1 APC family permease [Lacticaseibacillus sp. BCRC 81376]WFB40361.1 APC family permease [Lacticaseibacillus huelsenbergensis]
MKKKIGFWSIVLLAINSIIGSGIFLSPGAVVQSSGSKALILYGIAAFFAAILAVTFAAAAKYVAHSGAAYIYAKAAFGEHVGFYVGITRYIATCIAWGVMATAVVKTVLRIFGFDQNDLMLVTISLILLMLALLVINCFGPKFFELVNNLSTIGKLAALLVFIIFGVGVIATTGVNHFAQIDRLTSAGSSATLSTLVMGVIAAFYAFTGFESVASGADDMYKPEKNLPIAIPLAISVIAVVYIGVVWIAMMVNPQAMMATKEVVALVAVFNNPLIQNIVLYGALISMLGINVAASFHSPRVLEAIAKQGQLPSWLAGRTAKNFPLPAFLLTIALAVLLPMAFRYDMTSIIILSSISRFVQFLIIPLCVMKFFRGRGDRRLINPARPNVLTDMVCPAVSLILTVLLLIKFDWIGQFTILDANNQHAPNYFAIVAMILGYVVIPFGMMLFNYQTKKKRYEYD